MIVKKLQIVDKSLTSKLSRVVEQQKIADGVHAAIVGLDSVRENYEYETPHQRALSEAYHHEQEIIDGMLREIGVSIGEVYLIADNHNPELGFDIYEVSEDYQGMLTLDKVDY